MMGKQNQMIGWLWRGGLCLAVLMTGGDLASGQISDPEDPYQLLPGFNDQRVEIAAEIARPVPSVQATEEAGRLIWNLRRLNADKLDELAGAAVESSDADTPSQVGFRRLSGRVVGIQAIRIPEETAELLELSRLYRLQVRASQTDLFVVTATAPEVWASLEPLDEPIAVSGLFAPGGEEANTAGVLFANSPQWFPSEASQKSVPSGWVLLGQAGFDGGLLAGVRDRMREPLVAADDRPFYGMLKLAGEFAGPQLDPAQPTIAAEAVATPTMLLQPVDLVGQWIVIDVETVRLSRVVVQTQRERELLGADSFWQIDCFGDLGDTEVRLAGQGEAGEGEPLEFRNRFPVSVVIRELPEWLRQTMHQEVAGQGDIDVAMVRQQVEVTGFFYRLWSYRSEFTESRGGKQVAPLILAGQIVPRQELGVPAGGVRLIGWLMAAGVIGAIVAVTLVIWRMEREDKRIRAKRRGLST